MKTKRKNPRCEREVERPLSIERQSTDILLGLSLSSRLTASLSVCLLFLLSAGRRVCFFSYAGRLIEEREDRLRDDHEGPNKMPRESWTGYELDCDKTNEKPSEIQTRRRQCTIDDP